jgi:hypothetical protein
VRILNVCDERLGELALRKRMLSSRIAVQRAELEMGLQGLRRPFQAFDRAKAAGARALEHGPAIALILAPLLFLLRRPLIGGVGFAATLVKKATRWWTLWKLGSKIFAAMPHPHKQQRRYAA